MLRQPELSGRRRMLSSACVWGASVLVAGSSVMHFFLWLNYGYRNIPTISPLFLMQAVAGVVLALAASLSRHWLLAAAEMGFVLSSIGGLLISIFVGLFGWQEAWSGPWVWQALVIEISAAVILLPAVLLFFRAWLASRPRGAIASQGSARRLAR